MSDADTVYTVRLLWALMVPVETIAKGLQLEELTVQHIIEHGKLPAEPLKLDASND